MEIDLFKFCSGLRVLGYFMILLVGAIIGVSYYAVVLLTCGPLLLRVLWQRRMMDLGEDHVVVVAIAYVARMGSRRGAIIVLFVKDVFSRWTTIVSGW
ncbi:hypothetical protein CRYUN_Cryun23aG0122400 [Craigia yunnanensis]